MNLIIQLQKPNVQAANLVLLVGLLLVILPQFSHIPVWLSLVTTTLIIWRACFDLKLCSLPGKKILFLFTIVVLAGIVFSYHTLIGKNAGSAMLLGLLCLKLFEIKSFRDVALIINLALFSVVINFLFNQSIFIAATMLLALVFLFTALVGFQHDYKALNQNNTSLILVQSNEKQHFKIASKLLAQAIPFAVVLFILFPRVDGPLWGLPEDAFSAKTGLTDQMSPGKISNLSDDNSVAFRVKFDSAIPSTSKLYWRGPVMWHFDGQGWSSPNNERLALNHFEFSGIGNKTDYSITLQPHNNYWMFALDLPTNLPERSRFSANMQLLSLKPIQKLKRYDLSSYTQYVLPAYSDITMQRYLRLPEIEANNSDTKLFKSSQLINELKDKNDPQVTVKNVLNYFSTQDFYYTRQPPLLDDNPVDEFLFETKRGYCEHYASSFTVLMRLAGIPSRVVTGYQGGETNPIDDYMTVRQSDAHAWSEVFLGKKGWVRIDPTAAIPPGNIENINDARRLNSNTSKSRRLFESSWLTSQFKNIRFAWDAVNNRWNQWVLGYNNKKQKAFFAAIGIPEISWQGLSQLLFGFLAVLTAILALVIFSGQRKNKDVTQNIYFKFIKKVNKRGIKKLLSEGASSFCQRASLKLPKDKKRMEEITFLYQELRYKKEDIKKLKIFKHKVKSF